MLSGLVIILFGCTEDNIEPVQEETDELPPVEFRFTYAGNTFEADTTYWRINSADEMSFFASDPSGSSLYIEFDAFYGLGDYLFETDDFSAGVAKFMHVDNNDTTVYRIITEELFSIDGGRVDVDSTTANPKTYSGEFELMLIDIEDSFDSILVESGEFKYLREYNFDLNAQPGSISYWFDGQIYATENYEAFISGSNLVYLEIFDDRLPFTGKIRIVWPIEYDEDALLTHSFVAMNGLDSQVSIYSRCTRVNTIEGGVVFSQDGTELSTRIRARSYDLELELNSIELNNAFIPLEAGEGVMSQINTENQIYFNDIEGTLMGSVYHIEAGNDSGNFLVIEAQTFPAYELSIGYEITCFARLHSSFEFYEVEGQGITYSSNGWMNIDGSPTDDEFANIGFSSANYGISGGENQIIFAADSVIIQY